MNLRRATLFVRVVEESGFTAAARALGLPKSAVSSAVSLLEEELGVKLLNRSSRAVTLTEAGAALYRRAAPALRALDEASSEAIDAQGPLRGVVRLTAPVEVATRLLEPVLARFLASNPGVSLDLLLTTRVVDLVEEGLDLAVRGGALADESLVARNLGLHQGGLFAAPSYLEEHGRPRRLADLEKHACVVYRPVGGRGQWKLEGPGGREVVKVTSRVGADNYGFLTRAVVSGLGIGLLPQFLCKAELSSGELVRVLPKYALRETPLQLVYAPSRYLARPVAALRDFLVKELGAPATLSQRPGRRESRAS